MTTKPASRLTLTDRLSRLTFAQACKMLGDEGRKLIQRGSKYEFDIDEHVYLAGDLFRVNVGDVIVTVTMMADAKDRLHWNCTTCDIPCEHAGAALSLVLEHKTALGLAAPPPERLPVESLDEETLVERAVAERWERAHAEKFKVKSTATQKLWTDYMVTSASSGKTYRVALRGREPHSSYCSCPDFRTNTLGTCKHIIHVLKKVEKKFPAAEFKKRYRHEQLCVHLTSGAQPSLRFGIPDKLDEAARKLISPLANRDIDDVHDLIKRLTKLERLEQSVVVYPDAEEFIQQQMFRDRIRLLVEEIRENPAKHPLRTSLLKTELLPYQLDGIAFAAGAGRAVLADDMGLGKTIQGVGVAELLAQNADIRKVLVICPTSLKSQWRNEIERFSGRSVQLVLGGTAERATQYDNDAFFTICNYEQVLRDLLSIEQVDWDLIILDEGQRIKNWEAKTSNVVKSLKSKFALVLTGTPLENRLDDLYSVVQFVDDRHLGPAFRFFNKHRIVNEKGKVLGYKNLDELRDALKPILLRRTRDDVLKQLPERTTEIVRIAPTDEQKGLHDANMQVVASIVRKKFISEMDLLRLRQALLMCRMSADSTYLCNKEEPSYSSKLDRLDELFEQLFAEKGRKAVLFSEWTTMLNLIEKQLTKRKIEYVRLDGSVPQKQRQQLVTTFQTQPDCRLFLTTNAGSTGLNLQAANTVINVDLPWNPAVLEQRIARAHRMGQKQPVQVYVLVTEQTIEEGLLTTLSAKKELALAALDFESDVDEVSLISGTEDLKNRLEILLGAKPEAPVDESLKRAVEQPTKEHRERVAAAGGELLGAVFNFLGELVAENQTSAGPPPEQVTQLRSRLADCVEEDETGKQRLTITLPNKQVLDSLANTLARLLVAHAD